MTFEEVRQGQGKQNQVAIDRAEIVDLDELVGLLSYVIEGAALAPDRPIPWGGVSKLVKDINNRTSQIRNSCMDSVVVHSHEIKAREVVANSSLKVEPVKASPSRSVAPTKAEVVADDEVDETEVDTGLKSSALARRIQMAPRPAVGHGSTGSTGSAQGRVREIPLNEPR